MGGPFVSQSRVDTINQRVITEEIFIYAPEKLKRNLVRGMEASLYTIKLPGKVMDDAQIPLQDEWFYNYYIIDNFLWKENLELELHKVISTE